MNRTFFDRRSAEHLGTREFAKLVESEIVGGVFLPDLPPRTVLKILTRNRCYTAITLGKGQALISGHPEYCPQPVLVAISGCTWGGSMLKVDYLGRGMHMEFKHPEFGTPIVTSEIEEICESLPST